MTSTGDDVPDLLAVDARCVHTTLEQLVKQRVRRRITESSLLGSSQSGTLGELEFEKVRWNWSVRGCGSFRSAHEDETALTHGDDHIVRVLFTQLL